MKKNKSTITATLVPSPPKPKQPGIYLNKRIYDNLIDCRNIYDPDMPMTIFIYKMFNTKIKHVNNGGPKNSHVLDRFDAIISEFPTKDDQTKFYQLVNKNGIHYTLFLLQYLK